jgi:uncharacterized protein (DUF302 family)
VIVISKSLKETIINFKKMKYYISTVLSTNFSNAVEQTVEALKTEGFGVISEIDIDQKLKEKLNIDFRKYKILGACNPEYAYQALLKEDKVGTMLPCNVIVQEKGPDKTEIAAIDPMASMMAIENEELAIIGREIRAKLERVIALLSN